MDRSVEEGRFIWEKSGIASVILSPWEPAHSGLMAKLEKPRLAMSKDVVTTYFEPISITWRKMCAVIRQMSVLPCLALLYILVYSLRHVFSCFMLSS